MNLATVYSPEQLLPTIDALPVPAVVALNPAASSLFINSEMQKLLGLPSTRRVFDVHSLPYVIRRSGVRVPVEEIPVVRAATGAGVRNERIEVELRDGRVLTLIASASPILDVDARPAGSIATYYDATALALRETHDRDRLSYLTDVEERLSAALTLDSVLRTVEDAVVPSIAPFMIVSLLDEVGEPLLARMHHDKPQAALLVDRIRRRSGIRNDHLYRSLEAVRERRAATYSAARLIEGEHADPRYRLFMTELSAQLGLARFIVAPMLVGNEQPAGAILAASTADDRAFTSEDIELLSEIGRRAATAIARARLFEHHEEASKVFQEVLLPPVLPVDDRVRFDAVYVAGDDRALIGGDWYDAFTLPDGRIAVSLGDVTGRGVRAAALMGKVRQTISGLSYYESDPVKLLDTANMALTRRHPDAIVTAIVGVLDPESGDFTYASAGHPPPLLRRIDGCVIELPCHGLPLGLREFDDERSAVTFRLLPGDRLLLYTDGLTEATHDVTAGEARARTMLSEVPLGVGSPASTLLERALPEGSPDDIALLMLDYRLAEARANESPPPIALAFNSTDRRMSQDLRAFLLRNLTTYGDADADFDSAELVLGELLGNAARHASGPIDLQFDWYGEYPEITLRDRGPSYDVNLHYPDDPWSEGGRGLYLVGVLSRSFRVTRAGETNETTAELDVRKGSLTACA